MGNAVIRVAYVKAVLVTLVACIPECLGLGFARASGLPEATPVSGVAVESTDPAWLPPGGVFLCPLPPSRCWSAVSGITTRGGTGEATPGVGVMQALTFPSADFALNFKYFNILSGIKRLPT